MAVLDMKRRHLWMRLNLDTDETVFHVDCNMQWEPIDPAIEPSVTMKPQHCRVTKDKLTVEQIAVFEAALALSRDLMEEHHPMIKVPSE